MNQISMSSKNEPYALSDKAQERLHKKAIRRFEKQKNSFLVSGFDELNVINGFKTLYKNLEKDNRKEYVDLFFLRYLEILKREKPENEVDEIAEEHVDVLLSNPNPITKYSYEAEVLRKRDRASESVNAANGSTQKQAEMDNALRYWARQTDWYADFVSDDANLQALKDFGAEYVTWNTQEDGKVCTECRKRNGKTYKIDSVPVKPHPSCRCFLTNAKWKVIDYK